MEERWVRSVIEGRAREETSICFMIPLYKLLIGTKRCFFVTASMPIQLIYSALTYQLPYTAHAPQPLFIATTMASLCLTATTWAISTSRSFAVSNCKTALPNQALSSEPWVKPQPEPRASPKNSPPRIYICSCVPPEKSTTHKHTYKHTHTQH